jgi:hypothetical protein
MAIRIDSHVVSGEIDNRVRGRITGQIQLTCGTIALDLEGNCHPDVAGCKFHFRNPNPETAPSSAVFHRLNGSQTGKAGDMTVSRKVKDLLVPVAEFMEMDEAEQEKNFRWANSIYVEWFSEMNGRVVIESTKFEVQILEGPEWKLTRDEFLTQQEGISQSLQEFISEIGESLLARRALSDEEEKVPDEEAEMDHHMKRMDLLNFRIARRLEKEGHEGADWVRIYEEESARLRRERKEPEPEPLSHEEEAERAAWIEEMNAEAEEALHEEQADAWKTPQNRTHPLAAECRDFALSLMRDSELPESVGGEHPLAEIRDGVLIASGKLAGALNGVLDFDEWPPSEFEAPAVLVFLKKAREHLRDALMGMDSADAENLVNPKWRQSTRNRIMAILVETQRLIEEARSSLESDDPGF